MSSVESVATSSLKKSILTFADEKKSSLAVNFSPALMSLIQETKYMDRLGDLDIPAIALNVALQEEKFLSYIESLTSVCQTQRDVLGTLRKSEEQLLKKHIHELSNVLKPGVSTLNWNSLGISEYVSGCIKVSCLLGGVIARLIEPARCIPGGGVLACLFMRWSWRLTMIASRGWSWLVAVWVVGAASGGVPLHGEAGAEELQHHPRCRVQHRGSHSGAWRSAGCHGGRV